MVVMMMMMTMVMMMTMIEDALDAARSLLQEAQIPELAASLRYTQATTT